MTKKDIKQLVFIMLTGIALMGILEYYNQKFFSGVVVGVFSLLIALVTVGKYQAYQIGKHIEKKTRDYIVDNN